MRAAISFFSFFGRTRRTVYGIFSLATLPAFAVAVGAGSIAFMQTFGHDMFDGKTQADADMLKMVDGLKGIPHQAIVWIAIVTLAVWFVMVLAWVPLSVRRLHDMGGSGWISLAFAPVILLFSILGYLLICLVLSVWPGTNGANRYGRDPRRPDEIADVFADPGRPPSIVT